MGFINFSMPKGIVKAFKAAGGIKNFVETGTYKGGTSFWAAEIFEKVYTIEIDPERSRLTAADPNSKPNIEYFVGNSSDVLPQLVPRLQGRSLFWLDGHWCNTSVEGMEMECPLMDELKALAPLQDAVILIDDARAFLGPLPPPHKKEHWPRVDEIFYFFHEQFPLHLVTIADDVIYAIPYDLIEVYEKDYIRKFPIRFGAPRPFYKKVTDVLMGRTKNEQA